VDFHGDGFPLLGVMATSGVDGIDDILCKSEVQFHSPLNFGPVRNSG
jgi:hypothetical protein